MKAAVHYRYGPPDVLQVTEVVKPVPADNQVLVRVHASIASLAECALRKADPFIVRFFAGLFQPRDPTLGDVFAGAVEAVGAGVTRYAPSDRVFGTIAPASGTHAEYICVAETGALTKLPEGVGYEDGAALCDGFFTALPFLRDEAKLQPGQSILINGASGAIGTAAVQLAKYYGAKVTGVCSTPNLALVTSLGADRVIDYTQADFTLTGPYDAIFDTVGKSSFPRCRAALKPGGIYLNTVPSFAILRDMLLHRKPGQKRAKLATTGLRSIAEKAKDMPLLVALIEASRFAPVIDRTYPLAEIAEAHRYIETERKRGSVVISI
jgi:NADPH:quinone reductase-like Zn-dependent oxidoreductase